MSDIDISSAVAGEIMTPFVIKVGIDSILNDVLEILTEKNISAVFIHDKEKNEYFIISQTDIIRFLQQGGVNRQDLGEVPVTELMKGPIGMIDVYTPIDKVIRYLSENNFKRALISMDNTAAGVISVRDIMKWNDTYFKPSKPQVLLFMDNYTSNLIGKHLFSKNITTHIQEELIDLLGGALSSISMMTEEVIKQSGKISQLMKEKSTILFEPKQNITGILICDYNSIELRRKLREATQRFCEEHEVLVKPNNKFSGIHITLDVSCCIPIFSDEEKAI